MVIPSQSERVLTLTRFEILGRGDKPTRNSCLDTSQLPELIEIVVKRCDLFIPILLKNQRRMSYVLIQVKNNESLRQTHTKNEQSFTALSPHEKLDGPGCPVGCHLITEDLPKEPDFVASGVNGAVYPALREE